MRVASLEIFRFCEGDKSRRLVWLELARDLQYAANRWWQTWEAWHVNNGTVAKARASAEKRKRMLAEGTAKKDLPKPSVEPIPKSLAKLLYRTIRDEFPRLHSRVVVLFLQRMTKTVSKRKAANSTLPGWLAILYATEGRPSFTRPMPIPFDRQVKSPQVVLLPPDEQCRNWRVKIRIQRQDDGKSVVEVCELMTRRRKCRRDVSDLEKATDGRAKLCGSYLVYDRGKWFVKFSIDEPKQAAAGLDPARRAVLLPGRNCPWMLALPADGAHGHLVMKRGGRARHVAPIRRRIQNERRERGDNYRWGGRRGRGRKDAIGPWTKLSARWRNFVTRYNHLVTTSIVRELVSRGIGSLEYWQPEPGSKSASSRFLATQGKSDERRESSSWDFFQVKTLLANKCSREGIKFSSRKVGAKKDDDSSSEKAVA